MGHKLRLKLATTEMEQREWEGGRNHFWHWCDHWTSFQQPGQQKLAKTAVNWKHHFLCLLLLIELCMFNILLWSTWIQNSYFSLLLSLLAGAEKEREWMFLLLVVCPTPCNWHLIVMMTLSIHDTGVRLIVSWLMIHSWPGWSGWDAREPEEKAWVSNRNMWLSPYLLLSAICPPSYRSNYLTRNVNHSSEFCPTAILFADNVVSLVSSNLSLGCHLIIWQRRVPFEASSVAEEKEEACNLQWNDIVLLSDNNVSAVSWAGPDWQGD